MAVGETMTIMMMTICGQILKKRFFTWKTWIKYVLVPTVVLFFCGGFLLFVLLELSVWVSENKIIIPSS